MSHRRTAVLAALSTVALAASPVTFASPTETVLYSFSGGSDGGSSTAGLTYVNGMLYGTTQKGGTSGDGVVFAVNATDGTESVLHSFTGGVDGSLPVSSLIYRKGLLLGTTFNGGTGGVAFSVNATTGTENILAGFSGGSPAAGLTSCNGSLYGTTSWGGTSGMGTVFRLNPASGTETIIHSFKPGTDGNSPDGNLICVSGKLYGTTEGGGYGPGTVFSIDLASSTETVLHYFNGGVDGSDPIGRLVYRNGMLYGTTLLGGSANQGTLFAINLASGSEQLLHSFVGVPFGGSDQNDGELPQGGPVYYNGSLYGTTTYGGYGSGTVYAFNLKTGTESVLYRFNASPDGGYPYGDLIQVDGNFYGTTLGGGTGSNGTVFKVTP